MTDRAELQVRAAAEREAAAIARSAGDEATALACEQVAAELDAQIHAHEPAPAKRRKVATEPEVG